MKGHIAEVVPGKKYRVFVYAGRDPLTGKKRYRTRVVEGSRRTAETTLHRLAADVAGGDKPAAALTFGDLVEKWFALMAPRLVARHGGRESANH